MGVAVLQNVRAVTLTNGTIPQLTGRPRAPRSTATVVDMTTIPRAAVRAALELAKGDASRLAFLPDGTVLVMNSARRAYRTKEPRP
jgi:hypothetical protein